MPMLYNPRHTLLYIVVRASLITVLAVGAVCGVASGDYALARDTVAQFVGYIFLATGIVWFVATTLYPAHPVEGEGSEDKGIDSTATTTEP